MKKNLIYSALVLLFIFTGCSQKDVEIDTQESVNASNVDQMSGEQGVDSEANLDQIDTVEQGGIGAQGSADMMQKDVLEPVLFAFDKFSLTPEMLDVARDNSNKISNLGEVSVKLEGNCDEWGSDEYNYALGLKRAKTIKDVLTADGFNTSNISMVSYGESNPVCTEHNESCWSQNRRVDYKVNP